MFSHIDFNAFQTINHLAVSERILNPLMIFLAEWGEYVFFAGILFYWFYKISENKNRRMVVEALLAACLALGINVLIGMFIYRDRPFVHHHVNWLIPHAKNDSFPSDHATGAFVIAASIWQWKKRAGWLWLLLAAGISLSRVWTGVHYPADIIAGMLIGTGSAFAVHTLSMRSGKFGKLISFFINFYIKIESLIFKKKIINP
ncbi:undecaprenyl-diphosphatase [Neobacillus sp. PS3-34]|uniref:undecaprenyl-diphosphatase n=1 Tax=Neobacillus sp. PS3-34 TaxID=3070678 RepID=UPI0027DF758A|nr:undecaprenyl-diphosphatase [Neobacillus sp. PS3-34]WML47188.1 undecaprenyl-diphosphatase [Neobacillus sp. PS3-34]